eukprot:PhF_6_TR30108/c0_g2_i1/m.43939
MEWWWVHVAEGHRIQWLGNVGKCHCRAMLRTTGWRLRLHHWGQGSRDQSKRGHPDHAVRWKGTDHRLQVQRCNWSDWGIVSRVLCNVCSYSQKYVSKRNCSFV